MQDRQELVEIKLSKIKYLKIQEKMENQKGIANIIENDQPISLTYRT